MNGPMVIPASLFVGLWVLALVGLTVTLWAIIDAVSTPDADFVAVRVSKTRWIVAIALSYVLTAVVGIIVAVVYLIAIRPKLRVTERGRVVDC